VVGFRWRIKVRYAWQSIPLFPGPCFLNWIQGLFLFVLMFCKNDKLQYLAGYRLSRTNQIGLGDTPSALPFSLPDYNYLLTIFRWISLAIDYHRQEVGLAETNILPTFFLFITLLSHTTDSLDFAGYRLSQTNKAGLADTPWRFGDTCFYLITFFSATPYPRLSAR
jgi:hypothetical protein